jgi:hypothetical protein
LEPGHANVFRSSRWRSSSYKLPEGSVLFVPEPDGQDKNKIRRHGEVGSPVCRARGASQGTLSYENCEIEILDTIYLYTRVKAGQNVEKQPH